jgi:hypothetical protein
LRDITGCPHVDVHPAWLLVLPIRHEELRRHLLLHFAVPRVLDDSDDSHVEFAAVAVSRSHQLADAVIPQAELLCERLVDDGHLRGIQGVGIRELASGDERDAERGEIARTNFVVVGVAVRVWSGLEP